MNQDVLTVGFFHKQYSNNGRWSNGRTRDFGSRWCRFESYSTSVIKHDFAKDSYGENIENEYADLHPGLYCLRCGWTECWRCFPELLEEACDEQTPYLF
jgi:hypothetical protein